MAFSLSTIQDPKLITQAETIHAVTLARKDYTLRVAGLNGVLEDANTAAVAAGAELRENPTQENLLSLVKAESHLRDVGEINQYQATISHQEWVGHTDCAGLVYAIAGLRDTVKAFFVRIQEVLTPLLESSRARDIEVSRELDLANPAMSRTTSDLENTLAAARRAASERDALQWQSAEELASRLLGK